MGPAFRALGMLLVFAALLAPSFVRAQPEGGEPKTDPEGSALSDARAEARAVLAVLDSSDAVTEDRPEAELPGASTTLTEAQAEACASVWQSEQSELIDCGSEWSKSLDEPGLVSLLRRALVQTTQEQCTDLLTELWERESCQAGGRECGKLVPGSMPAPQPKLASGASGDTCLAHLCGQVPQSRRLEQPGDESVPRTLAPTPPSPPPRS